MPKSIAPIEMRLPTAPSAPSWRSKQDRERYGGSGNEADSQIAQHGNEHKRNQDQATQHNMANGVGRRINEVGAVIDGADMHARR